MVRPDQVCQFTIVPEALAPPVWRTVQVPASYSFWDVHVAIRDAMGWLDHHHLHLFAVRDEAADTIRILLTDEIDG